MRNIAVTFVDRGRIRGEYFLESTSLLPSTVPEIIVPFSTRLRSSAHRDADFGITDPVNSILTDQRYLSIRPLWTEFTGLRDFSIAM